MSVSDHLLILLIPMFSFCGATEYYIRPTEPANTSCPAQPCLTLSQYINDYDHYFQSNTVFKFLPGIHYMDKRFVMAGGHNISWTNFKNGDNKLATIVVRFSCDEPTDSCTHFCCAAIELYSLHSVTFEGITLTMQTPDMSKFTSKNKPGGISIYGANSVGIHTLHLSNFSDGLGLYTTNNTIITNMTAVNSDFEGIYLWSTINTTIVNPKVRFSGTNGMHLSHTSDTILINATILKQNTGMYLDSTSSTTIINPIAMNSSGDGVYISTSTNTTIIDPTVWYSSVGVFLFGTTSTAIFNPHAQNNTVGIYLTQTTTTVITNPTLLHNGDSGIILTYANKTIITNLTVTYSQYGIKQTSSINTTLKNASMMHNNYNGIYMKDSTDTCIVNLYLSNHSYTGLYFADSTDIIVINTTILYSGSDGIFLLRTTHCTIVNLTVLHSAFTGVHFKGPYNANIILLNPILLRNKEHGLLVDKTSNTTIINPIIMYNGEDGMVLESAENIDVINATVMFNGWNVEVPTFNGDILIESSSHTRIYNSSFANISSTSRAAASSADLTSFPAVIVLYSTSLHISGCNFTGNSISAVKAFTSNITISGDLIFSGNKAIVGSAFVLAQNSILKLTENSYVHFTNNYVTDNGGVFYIAQNVHYGVQNNDICSNADTEHHPNTLFLQSTCFFSTEGSRLQSGLFFVNNSAANGGDVLYGGHISYGLDGDWNCLLSFKNISNISQNGLSLITSDPSRVCLCNRTEQPDCSIVVDHSPHSIYPGQTIILYAVVVGQDFGTVTGSVYAQFLQKTVGSPHMQTWQMIQGVTQEACNHLNYTIYAPVDVSGAVLILTANNINVSQFYMNEEASCEWEKVYRTTMLQPLEYSNYPVYINISFLPCPAGFMLREEPPFMCDCSPPLQQLRGVKCYIQDQTISRSGLVWVGTLKDDNETVVASEYCLFDYCNKKDNNVTLSDPDSQCNYNHSGTLCGGCQPGLSLALGSAQCLPCSNKYLALLIPFALAGPVLIFSIKLLDITTFQGTINGLVFYANIVQANQDIFLPQRQTNLLTLFIAWLNLDLGVETCFFHGLTAYSKTWLQFVFPLYIWSIAGLIIVLANCSDRVAKVMGTNSVPVLATLLLLSYAKLFRIIITALSYTMLYSSQGHKVVWSADGNVDYLGPKHAPLFAVAVAALLFLWFPYTFLLFIGPWLYSCNCWLNGNSFVKTFLHAHYDFLKSKHRYWFGVLLVVRAVILLMSALIPTNHADNVILCISVIAVVLNYYGLLLYRSTIVAMYDISFFTNLALLGVASFFTPTVRGDQTVATYTLVSIAFIQFLGLVLFKVLSILKRNEKVVACIRRRQPTEDDWELYEEAARQREMESDHEEEESDGSDSIESLPTY